ncbi:MAG: deoxyribodipyrimidine photolyase [Desulfobacterales bacterium]|nr:deoxyribodipyrimidine photolyase [Desulfobacterales bacterium]
MHEDRLKNLNAKPISTNGDYVLYWMQQSQRAHYNHALEYAISLANSINVGVVVCLGITEKYPEANLRHFGFMLQGLSETQSFLHERGIKFVIKKGSPPEIALNYARRAAAVVCDRGYLKHQRQWRRYLGKKAKQQVTQVEGDSIVPVEQVSDTREFAARTIRPKIHKLVDIYLQDLCLRKSKKNTLNLEIEGGLNVRNPEQVLSNLSVADDVKPSQRICGGTSVARKKLQYFILSQLQGYANSRNDPASPQCSELSPYLHFGQISPIEIALKVKSSKSGSSQDKEAFLEELLIRRELAINFVFFEKDYDRYSALPDWAKKTLHEHRNDTRPYRYTRKQMENGETHDEAWNAAMREMRETGYMHNYMRMYWGKKILEWTNTPKYGYATALYLNNKYFIDGRDPSSYSNIAWIFGLHDRPWKEREVFGKVRYMNEKGLRRKFDITAYIDRVDRLVENKKTDQ